MKNTVLRIDRSQLFDPEKFLGPGWTIVEEDERSLTIAELDFGRLHLQSVLVPGEMWTSGVEQNARLQRIKSICADAKILATLWSEQNRIQIPTHWQRKTNNQTTYLIFRGTKVRSPGGSTCCLGLHWGSNQKWHWRHYWDDSGYGLHHQVVIIT